MHNVAEVIVGHLGKGQIKLIDSKTHLHEARLLQLNCDKAHQMLGWQPRWNTDQTLEATAIWYKTVMNGGKAEDITRRQIQMFFPEL